MSTALALPDVASATLPATYQHAKEALAACHQVDECKDWADKAAALASYAKQADDDTLHKLAIRIQARAIRRAGELLEAFRTGPQGGRPKENGRGTPTVSQRQAAADAGMSKDQEVQAVRVARVPPQEFEAAVESEQPPTVTALAARGTVTRPVPPARRVIDMPPVSTPQMALTTRLIGLLHSLSEFCEAHTPTEIARGLFSNEPALIRTQLLTIDAWMDAFVAAMEAKAHGRQ